MAPSAQASARATPSPSMPGSSTVGGASFAVNADNDGTLPASLSRVVECDTLTSAIGMLS